MQKHFSSIAAFFVICLLVCQQGFAHNGRIGYAHPLPNIKIDGDFSDWPKDVMKYPIATFLSDTKAVNDADYNGFFQIGYRLEDHSLYIAFTITDDDFLQDTSANVKWDSQDGLELYLDARHLPVGSAVASFMYSEKLHTINKSAYDPFTKNASWDITEIVMKRNGNTRLYEWRIRLGDQLQVGKSIGLDFFAFDRDTDGSFSFASWGKGESKYVNAKSLGDILILPASQPLSNISGTIHWSEPTTAKLPQTLHLKSVQHPSLWVSAEVDSTGKYAARIPAGTYTVSLPAPYYSDGKASYEISMQKPVSFTGKPNHTLSIPAIAVNNKLAPHLIPEKGVMLNYTKATEKEVDRFIETYMKYFNIPGVSLALVKDGKLAYYKTYGVKNTITGEKVDSNTLFEAASVTKPVFSFAVHKLVERGVINLDTPLYRYLPYPDIAYDDRYKLITGRHVLTHRTGFPNWRWMNPDGKLNLLFTPGTKYNYSGEGFEYLKKVVEKVTGKKVEQVLQEEVIEPIGLYHTFFSRNDSLRRMVAEGHYDGLPNYDELPDEPGMAYSMHTEAKIFTRFMIYLLEQKGLKTETYQQMFSKHSEFTIDPGDQIPRYPDYMGEGFEIRETPFGKSFGHGGNNGDFTCYFEVYKDLKAGYVIFTNANTSGPLLTLIRDFLVEGRDPKKVGPGF
jgi:CubicO group peptidase (beta-lactamase class C family)